jgi:hypothetical protein
MNGEKLSFLFYIFFSGDFNVGSFVLKIVMQEERSRLHRKF